MALRTFLDAGVLIAGAKGEDEVRERALSILTGATRKFVVSSFLYLEVAPKANRRTCPPKPKSTDWERWTHFISPPLMPVEPRKR